MNTAFKEDNVRPFVGINWSLENVATEARRGLELVAEGEERSFEGWLIYGESLNEGRRMFSGKESDREFGEWLMSNNLSDMANQAERAAAMWAAENREELATVIEGPMP